MDCVDICTELLERGRDMRVTTSKIAIFASFADYVCTCLPRLSNYLNAGSHQLEFTTNRQSYGT